MVKKDLGAELQHTKIKPNQTSSIQKAETKPDKKGEFKNTAPVC